MEPVTAVLAPGAAATMVALAVALPLGLLLAMAVPAWRPAATALAPAAGLGALAAGLLVPDGAGLSAAWLLTGVRLEVGPLGRPFLLLVGLLWPAAGVFARSALPPSAFPRFAGFYLAALIGTTGLCLAPGPVAFYTFYAIMSLAIYGLVIHDGSRGARRAANIYLGFTVAGEAALLAALLLGVSEGVLAGPWGVGLAIAALGIKFGLVPLHMWMPLAYGAAPVAAGAVLGGAMVNAGLLGLLRFLPLGQKALPGWGELLVVLGAVAAFGGVLVGLTQRNPKALLGYSSISQMGWVTLAIGAALIVPGAWRGELQAVVLAYAAHHGLVKGGLFLALGLNAAAGGSARRRRWAMALLVVLALMLAGAPGTSGAAAKLALKHALAHLPGADAEAVAALLAAGALATTLLLGRLVLLARINRSGVPAGPAAWASALVPALAALAMPWLWPVLRPEVAASLGTELMAVSGPVVAGAALAALAAWALHGRALMAWLALPAGDLLWLLAAAGHRLGDGSRRRLDRWRTWWVAGSHPGEWLRATLWLPMRGWLTAADRWGWATSGLAMLLLLGALAATLVL